jgi:hypothetical protein
LKCQTPDNLSTVSEAPASPASPAEPKPDSTELASQELTALRHSAEDALARKFSIFACEPRSKAPLAKYAPHGFKNATTDPLRATLPWQAGIAANYGVAAGASDLTIVDADHGLKSLDDLKSWMERNHLPETLVVQTGRDGDAGFHLYYSGSRQTTGFELDGVTGELKSEGGYVVGPGSIHPSGKKYTIVNDAPVAPFPASAFPAKAKAPILVPATALVHEGNRWEVLRSKAGSLRNIGLSEQGIYDALKDFAANRCENGENYPDDKIRDLAHAAVTVFEETPSPTGDIPKGYIMTAEEWRDYEFPPADKEALIGTDDNTIVRPLTKNLVIAPDKAFKTTFLMRMMAGMASGETVFDELPVLKPCRVLYFHAELNPAEIQQRVIASIATVDTHGRFINVRDIRVHLIEKEGQAFIADTVEEHQPDVVVLDPWQELIRGYDELSGKDTSVARGFINRLIDTFKVTVFLVQHMGNDESKGGRGHSGMKGWRDTLFTLKKAGEDHVRATVEPRWGKKFYLELAFKDGTVVSTFVNYTIEQTNLRNFITHEHPEGVTSQQVAEKFEKTQEAAKKMLQRAVKDGAVVKTADGLFLPQQKGEIQ